MNDAELYAKSSSLQQQFVNKVLEELWPALDWRCEQGTVLDVGCGAGDVTRHELLPRLPPGISVLAVDISPAMVAKAADRYSGPRLYFRQLDIGTPHIEETDVWRLGPFPKVFSFFCLHWVQDQRIIVSSTPYLRAKDPVGELTKNLHEAGLCVKTCRSGENSYSSMDEQDLINTVNAINPFIGRIPQQLQKAFMQDCVTEAYKTGMIRAYSLPNGTVYSHSYSAVVAHAIKS